MKTIKSLAFVMCLSLSVAFAAEKAEVKDSKTSKKVRTQQKSSQKPEAIRCKQYNSSGQLVRECWFCKCD